MANSPPTLAGGCLRMLLTTLAMGVAALWGVELWLDRWSWPVDERWYRIEASDGIVRFGCQDFAPVQFSARPAPGVRRVLVVGGSTTFGFPERPSHAAPIEHARHGFVGAMQRALDARWPGRVELVNLGVNGGASEDALRILRRAIAWGPEGLLIYDGHNEFMGVPRSFSAGLWRFALYRRLSALAPHAVESPGWTGAAAYGGPAQAQAVWDRFRRNLGAMVSMGREAGIPVVVGNQASNLSDFDPSWSTGGQVEGMRDLPPEEVEARLAASPESADLAFAAARSRAEAGRRDADEAYRQARDHDAMPFRASTAINEAIREVAEEGGAVFVDVEAAMSTAVPGGVPGAESFHDWVHPTPVGAARIASALLDGMARAGLIASPLAAVPQELEGSEAAEQATREAVAWLQWAMVRHHDPLFRLGRAHAWAEQAMGEDPQDALARAIDGLTDDLIAGKPVTMPTDLALRAKVEAIHPRLREGLTR